MADGQLVAKDQAQAGHRVCSGARGKLCCLTVRMRMRICGGHNNLRSAGEPDDSYSFMVRCSDSFPIGIEGGG